MRAATSSLPPPFIISVLCREGAKARRAFWTLYARENALGVNRIKISLPRLRPRRSVLRNRYRRRIREALRGLTRGRKGWDFFLISRKFPQEPFPLLQGELKQLLHQVGYLP